MNNSDVFRPWATNVIRGFAVLVGLLWSGVLGAATHYVSLDGGNQTPYTNGWTSAATQIQWAVNVATNGETVLVSNGTYNLTNQIELTNSVTVKSLNGTNLTFINGNYPAYTNRCVFMSGGSVLDGFTISNGFLPNTLTNGPAGYPFVGLSIMYRYDLGGAGIGIRGVATVKNCYVYKNSITNGGGGGINVYLAYNVTISNCTVVSNNASSYGGGIYWDNCSPNPGLLIDSYISGNTGGYGAGVANLNTGCRITNCTIAGNSASIGAGGVHLQNLSGVDMADCVVSNNSAPSQSESIGGVFVYGSQLINSTIIGNRGGRIGGVWVVSGNNWGSLMSNCQVIANNGLDIPGGGINPPLAGVGLTGATGWVNAVANCIIASNFCNGWNGAPDAVAGICAEKGGLVKNCLIYGNTNTYNGGGVQLFDNALYTNYPYGLINCTIVDNKASARSGINAAGSSNYIANCIVVSNVTAAGAQANIYNDTAANTNNYWYTCTPDILAPNQGNITDNPLFADRPNYNYRLSAGSPCINAGTNQDWMTGAFDLDGQPRIRYGTVDMGVYEVIYSGTIFSFH